MAAPAVYEPMVDKSPFYHSHDMSPGRDPYNPHIPDGRVPIMHDFRLKGFPKNQMMRPWIPYTYTPREVDPSKVSDLPPPPPMRRQSTNSPPPADYGPDLLYGANLLPGSKQPSARQPQITDTFADQKVSKEDADAMRLLQDEEAKLYTEPEMQKWKKHQKEAENEIEMLKEEKRRRLEAHRMEQRRDMHMLQNYNPWGKPGGGAPNPFTNESDANRKQKFTEYDLKQDKTPRLGSTDDSLPFYRPGAGAPLRTKSGRLLTEVPGDASIRFKETNKGRDLNEPFRYRPDPETAENYAKELEKLMEEQNNIRHRRRIEELNEELETLQYHPYGRPGAGAPNRPYNGELKLPVIESPEPQYPPGTYNPWGKGYGNPDRVDDDGNVRRYRFHDRSWNGTTYHPTDQTDTNRYKIASSLELGQGSGAGEPIRADNGAPVTRLPITMDKSANGEMQAQDEYPGKKAVNPPEPTGYFPFGSSGGGAPNVDEVGNVQTHIYGESTVHRDMAEEEKKARAAREYSEELQKEIMQQRLKQLKEKQTMRAPVNDFSSLMAYGQTGRPKRYPDTGTLARQDLNSTDVTQIEQYAYSPRLVYQHKPAVDQATREHYSSELERAADERRRLRKLERLKDQQEARQHGNVFNDMWGRPGGGAPKGYDNNRMQDLQEALHYNRYGKNEFKKPVDHIAPVKVTNYVKNDIRSSHENLYEMAPPKGRRGGYHTMYPFAVQ